MRRIVRTGFVFLLVFVVLPACSQVYNPVTGKFDRTVYDREDEIRVGKSAYPRLIQLSNGRVGDKKLQSYVSEVGNRIARVSHDPFFDYEFSVVNDSTPNAWALPGGKIGITRGLLLEMESEGQLAAVLGHEITHVTARHSARQQTRSLTTNLVFLAGTIALKGIARKEDLGDLETLLMFGGSIGVRLYLSSYSREHERESDRHGMWYMARAGYDPEGMVDLHKLFQNMRDRQPTALETWFSTHPAPADRVAAARNRVEKIRSSVDIPKQHRVNKFQERVVEVWHPRKKAYEKMDRGTEALQNGNHKKAETFFRQAIDQYEEESLFHSWLAIAEINQGNRPAAYRSMEKALNRRPDLFHTRMSAGRVYLVGRDHKQSITHFQKAKERVDAVPVIDFYIGRNHEALGNRSRAVEHYRRYLDRGGRGEKAQYAVNRLQKWGVIEESSNSKQ